MSAPFVVAMLVVPAVFAGCSQHVDPPPPEEPVEVIAEAVVDEPPPRAALDPDTACGRARACCEAFAGVFTDVVVDAACEGPYEASESEDADGRCERMTLGWREALAHHPSGTVPASCAAP